jgi:AcrR family transcriptional regulator
MVTNSQRTALLDSAEHNFATHGFHRASLARIGAGANVSRGLPSYFFKSKQALYAAVMERAAEKVRTLVSSAVRSQPAGGGPELLFSQLADAYIDFLTDHPTVVRLLQWQFLDPSDNERGALVASVFADAIAAFTASLNLPSDRERMRLVLLSVVGMCIFPFIVDSTFHEKPETVARHKSQVIQIIIQGIRLGGRPTEGNFK